MGRGERRGRSPSARGSTAIKRETQQRPERDNSLEGAKQASKQGKKPKGRGGRAWTPVPGKVGSIKQKTNRVSQHHRIRTERVFDAPERSTQQGISMIGAIEKGKDRREQVGPCIEHPDKPEAQILGRWDHTLPTVAGRHTECKVGHTGKGTSEFERAESN